MSHDRLKRFADVCLEVIPTASRVSKPASSDSVTRWSLYADGNGEPVLRHSFVAFIDVLGTRPAMANFTDDDLRQQIRRLDETRWLVHEEAWAGEFQRMLSFSDSLVVGFPVDLPLEGGTDLGWLITSLLPYILSHAR